MKKAIIFLFLCLSLFAQAQDTTVIVINQSYSRKLDEIGDKLDQLISLLANADSIDSTTPAVRSGKTIKEVIGINGGLLLAGLADEFDFVENQRVFYLTSHDMQNRRIDEFMPNPCLATCPNIDCDWSTTNAAWKYRFCDYDQQFKFNTLSIENLIDADGKPRSYPDKFWSAQELGKDPFGKGYTYGQLLAKSLSYEVDAIEVGNELHGSPGLEYAKRWSYGVAAGVKSVDTSIIVVSPDLSGKHEEFAGKYIQTDIADWDLSKFDVVQCHEYGFDKSFRVTLPPEEFLIPELKSLQGIAQPLWVGEFGFDSDILGEELQASYIIRSYLIAMRYGVEKAFLYAAVDDGPWAVPFEHIGLIERNGNKKQSYFRLKEFSKKYGDFRFAKALKDGPIDYKYQFSDGKDVVTFSWTTETNIITAR